MSEELIIQQTLRPNTASSITKELQALGVCRGDILIVHSSLSSMGWVCGGAHTVIRALLDTLGEEGTLVTPAHSGDWSDPADWCNPPVPADWLQPIYDEMPAYDPLLTPTRGMGRIVETFRAMPGTLRSAHPQTSWCAYGKHAREILAEHPLTPQFGMGSPLGKLYEMGARVLLLGVGYQNCTCFHLSEALAGNIPMKKSGTAMEVSGQRQWVWFEDYEYNSDDFDQPGDAFELSGQVHSGLIGNARCRLFDMKAGVDFTYDWIKRERAQVSAQS